MKLRAAAAGAAITSWTFLLIRSYDWLASLFTGPFSFLMFLVLLWLGASIMSFLAFRPARD